MSGSEWLPLLASGAVMFVWRRIVLALLRAGRIGPRAAAAAYASVIPALVLIAFALAGRFGPIALVYALVGFGLSYPFALLVFRRAELIRS